MEYFSFFAWLAGISIVVLVMSIFLIRAKKNKIMGIVLLVISIILFFIGLAGCFLIIAGNTGSYRY